MLAPDFGETQGKILGTSLCVTGAVVVALACEPAWERRLLGPYRRSAPSSARSAFALAIAGIWLEPDSDTFGKAMGTIFVLAAACALASLLALARLAPRHGWVFAVTLVLIGLGAAMLSVVFWLGEDPPEAYLRALGVVMIALAALTVTVPVLHWVDRGTLAAAEAVIGAVRFCPYCGREVTGERGVDLECPRCGMGFRISAPASPREPAVG